MEKFDPGEASEVECELFQSKISEAVEQKNGSLNRERLHNLLEEFGERLDLHLDEPVQPIVIGGSALNVLNIVQRPTVDVDIVGQIGEKSEFEQPDFPKGFWEQVREFSEEQSLDFHWMNQGPTILGTNMPEGFLDRTRKKSFGENLAVHFADRYDQIHFKLFAGVDKKSYHLGDLRACEPTDDELVDAVRWIENTQNPSDIFRERLFETLRKMGRDQAVEKIVESVEPSKQSTGQRDRMRKRPENEIDSDSERNETRRKRNTPSEDM